MKEQISKENAQKLTREVEKNKEKYSKAYDENIFLKIVKNLPRAITENFVKLYFIMKNPDIPVWAKAVCVAALGYVVLPFDIIPNFILGFGWLDDIAIVGIALAQMYGQKIPWWQKK